MAPKPGKRSPSTGAVQKHRACDECRSRKLACSKERDGCARCRREGLACHYSPQKPMGRPRKRRHLDDESDSVRRGASASREEPLSQTPQPQLHSQQPLAPPHSAAATPSFFGYDAAPMMPMDPQLSFIGPGDGPGGMDFLDLLPTSYGETIHGAHTVAADPQILFAHDLSADGPDSADGFPLGLGSDDFFGGMPFEPPSAPYAAPSKEMADSLHHYMMAQYSNPLDPPESAPSDLSNSAGSPEPLTSLLPRSSVSSSSASGSSSAASGSRTLKPNPNIACGCLSSLYLTLDSLSRLPSDICAAMRVARNASKIASDVVNCPYCSSSVVDDITAPVPVQAYQNLMCLAALVPSACNAYAAILEMVDREAASAAEEGRTLWFSFKDIGGIWGRIGEELSRFYTMQSYNNKHMTPDFWRTTIRAVLRLDVYGITEMKHPAPSEEFRQQGLRDVVVMLEERSRKRHDIMDDLIAKGEMPTTSDFLFYPGAMKPCALEDRNCYRMLETARMALENLVIA